MSNSNVTPAPTAESIYQMLKERTLSQEAFGVDIDYVFTPSDRLEPPLPLYVRRQPGFEEASDEDIAQPEFGSIGIIVCFSTSRTALKGKKARNVPNTFYGSSAPL